MAANYNYPPPPPPPSAGHTAYPSQYQQPRQPSYGGHPQPRGGNRGRGRGGSFNQGGRGDFHASSQYNQHAGGYNGPPQVVGGYMQQQPASYIGPQAPAPAHNAYAPQGGPPQQWHDQQQMHHQPPHHQQVQIQQAPAPVPLSAQNYHPNYAPQVYQQPQTQQPQQYGPQQPPFQHHSPPPQNSFAQHHAPSPQSMHPSGPPQSQWQPPPPQVQPPYQGGARGRGRGGPPNRGGFDAPLMGPPIRMGFDNERAAEPMPQASNGYAPPYVQQQSPPNSFSQPSYQGYPPQNSFQRAQNQRSPLEPNPFYGQEHRGRGGFPNRGRGRDGPGDRFRGRGGGGGFPRYRTGPIGPHSSETPQKPAEEVPKLGESKKKKKKKRKTNTLGLTPGTEDYMDSEEEDDVNEEERLIPRLEAGLVTAQNLQSWLAERRAKWPTRARREAAAAELAQRRAAAAEQSARDKAANKLKRDQEVTPSKSQEPLANENQLDKQQRRIQKAEHLRQKLEKAERKIQELTNSSTKRKRDDEDVGDEVDGVKIKKEKGDFVDQVIAKAEAQTNNPMDSDSDSSDGSTDSDDSDDSGPESRTTRTTGPVRVPPPAPSKKAILNRQCKYYSTGGTCGKKGKCRFIHDEAVRADALREKELNGGRPTLSQRLIQNENEKNQLTVVKSIQYLARSGSLDEPESKNTFAPPNGHKGHYSQNGFSHNNPPQDGYGVNGYDSGYDYSRGLQYDGAADINPFHSYDDAQSSQPMHVDDEV